MKTKSAQQQYMERINAVVDYINRQVIRDWSKQDETFDAALNIRQIIEKSDKVVSLSHRYFQQFFMRTAGESVGAYINRLRMERAAFLLLNTDKSVTDVACTVGYTSENSFFKSFKKHFEMKPKEYRERQPLLTPPFPVQDVAAPEESLITLPSKHLIYTSHTGDYSQCNSISFDKDNWDFLYEYAEERRLLPSEPEYYGICYDDSTIRRPHRCRFYSCMTVAVPAKRDGVVGAMEMAGGRYAVYKQVGSYDRLEAFYTAIFRSFPYELRDDFILERYLNSPQDVAEEALETDVMIPIVSNRKVK